MNIYTKTDRGIEREENQDTVWGEKLSEKTCAAVLCDGMGGESNGALASQMAVDIISRRIKESYSDMMNHNSVRNLLITAAVAANSIVYEESNQRKTGIVMGTTCVACIVTDGMAHIVNIGDSRAYHLFSTRDDDCIRQITKDHTFVREMVDKGELTEEQARNHHKRSRITRAIGAEPNVTPDYFEMELGKGDKLLLCSDGLSSYGDDMDILDIVFEVAEKDCCDALVKYANNNGGHDNVSVAYIVNS